MVGFCDGFFIEFAAFQKNPVALGEGLSFLQVVVTGFLFAEIFFAEGIGCDESVCAGVPPGWVTEVFGVIHHGDDGGLAFGVGAVNRDPLGALAPDLSVNLALGVGELSLGDISLVTESGRDTEGERAFLGVGKLGVDFGGDLGIHHDGEGFVAELFKLVGPLFLEDDFVLVGPVEIGR